jgi:hypothetical protein
MYVRHHRGYILSRFENFIPFVFRFFADLAGVEGPWVPLMLGDAPSLLEHLESNLKSNEFSKLSLAVRLRVIACYRDRFVCVFSFPIPHPPVRLSLSLILSTLPSFFWFSLSAFLRFLFVWPQLKRQLESCPYPHNFSGAVAIYRRVCQVANLGPSPEKFRSFLSSSFFTA